MPRIFCAAALACVLAVAQPTWAEDMPVPPAVPGLLVYSDQSPGAIFYAEVWKSAGEIEATPTTFVTDVTQFLEELSWGPWARVVVIARYAPGEPAYGAALRAYAVSHQDIPVMLFIWHDNGTNPGANTVVRGSTAISLWRHGRTTIAYAFTSAASAADSPDALRFPDFAGLTPHKPLVLARLAPEVAQSLSDDAAVEQLVGIIGGFDPCEPEPIPSAGGGMGGAGPGVPPFPLFLSGSGDPSDPMYCDKCVDNEMVQQCFEESAWPRCSECKNNVRLARDELLAYVNNVIEPALLAQCNQFYRCYPALRSLCRLSAQQTASAMRTAIEAAYLVDYALCAAITCPDAEADCVNAFSCLVPEGAPCPEGWIVGDSGIPCYPEDLAALGCPL